MPNADQVVISLERLRGVICLDEINGIVTCHAGTTLQALSDAVASKGFLVPLDLVINFSSLQLINCAYAFYFYFVPFHHNTYYIYSYIHIYISPLYFSLSH